MSRSALKEQNNEAKVEEGGEYDKALAKAWDLASGNLITGDKEEVGLIVRQIVFYKSFGVTQVSVVAKPG